MTAAATATSRMATSFARRDRSPGQLPHVSAVVLREPCVFHPEGRIAFRRRPGVKATTNDVWRDGVYRRPLDRARVLVLQGLLDIVFQAVAPLGDLTDAPVGIW